MHLFSRVFHRKLDAQLALCVGCGWTVPNLRGLLLSRALSGDGRDAMRCCPLSCALDALSTRVLLYLFLPRSDLAWFLWSSSIGWSSQVRLHRSSGRSCFSSTVLKWRQRASWRPTGGARAWCQTVKKATHVYLHVCYAVHCSLMNSFP